MSWFTKRKLLKLLDRESGDLAREAADLVRRNGLPDYVATDPLYFGDVIAAYRAELDYESPIDGLEDTYVRMSRKGGESIIVHNFRHDGQCWSLVSDGDLRRCYGVMVAREPIDFAARRTERADDGRARETRKYGLRTFGEGRLGGLTGKLADLLGTSSEAAEIVFHFDPSHPGGREQPGSVGALGDVKALGKEPVAVEWTFAEDRIRVSGSGNRITVVVNVADRGLLERLFGVVTTELELAEAEFAF